MPILTQAPVDDESSVTELLLVTQRWELSAVTAHGSSKPYFVPPDDPYEGSCRHGELGDRVATLVHHPDVAAGGGDAGGAVEAVARATDGFDEPRPSRRRAR